MASPTRSSYLRFALPLGLPLLAGLWGGPAAAAPACTLTSFDSVVDFGTIRPSPGSETEIKPSPQRRTITAICPDPTQMSVVFHGQTDDASDLRFGPRGRYAARTVLARLDGEIVQLARLPAAGQPPAEDAAGELKLLPSDVFAPASGRQLLSGKRLDVTLEIAPVVPVDAIRINESVNLDATAQLQLVTP